jgi:hypothetical protein
MEENQKEIQRQFRQQQEKYVYYVLSLSVSSIAFAVYRTSGIPMKYSQIPLLLSIISWSGSIFCGLMFIKYVISTLFANNTYFEIIAGRYPEIGDNSVKIEAGISGIKQAMIINKTIGLKYFKWQGRLFYVGILLFIIWHILEMYLLIKI